MLNTTPGEIRNRIWHFALPQGSTVKSKFKAAGVHGFWTLTTYDDAEDLVTKRDGNAHYDFALLHVNRFTRVETASLYATNYFTFSEEEILNLDRSVTSLSLDSFSVLQHVSIDAYLDTENLE